LIVICLPFYCEFCETPNPFRVRGARKVSKTPPAVKTKRGAFPGFGKTACRVFQTLENGRAARLTPPGSLAKVRGHDGIGEAIWPLIMG
jgi:hypothetical protein